MSVLRCKKTFVASVNGRSRSVRRGDLVPADSDVVKGRDSFFETVEENVSRTGPVEKPQTVERATAEPGERRSVGRPKLDAAPEEKPVGGKAAEQIAAAEKRVAARRAEAAKSTPDKDKLDGEV